MKGFLAYLIATMITLPIPMVILVYILALKMIPSKKRALHFTVNSTTLLFIFAVEASLYVITENSYFWMILIFLILLLSLSVFLQWKVREEIQIRRAWKGFWRTSFLLFSISYIGLVVYGITERILAL